MEIIKNRIYKHFKGDYYIVIDTAINNEDAEEYVIYRGLYGNGQLFVRELSDFTAIVDKQKYPNATQEFKFELQDVLSVNPHKK